LAGAFSATAASSVEWVNGMHSKTRSRVSTPSRAHIEELLDEALEQTFPASDPVAIAIEKADTGADVEVATASTTAGELGRRRPG
jgi:hypothetical protein